MSGETAGYTYQDLSAWRDYMSRLAELESAVSGALRAFETLVSSTVGKALGDVARDRALLSLILGGARLGEEAVELPEGSMARFTRDVLGVGLAEEDLRELASLLRRGAPLTSIRGLSVKGFSRSSEALSLLRDAESSLRSALSRLGVQAVPKGYPLTPDGILDAIYETANAAGPLLPTHNIIGLLIYSTSQIPEFYLHRTYPGLDRLSSALGQLGLDLVSGRIVEDPLGRPGLSLLGHGQVLNSVARALEDLMKFIELLGRPELCPMVQSYMAQATATAMRFMGTTGRELLNFPRDLDVSIDLNGKVELRQMRITDLAYEDFVMGLAPALTTHIVSIVRAERRPIGYELRLRINRCPGGA